MLLAGDFPTTNTYKLIKEKKVTLIDNVADTTNIRVVNVTKERKKKVLTPVLGELLRKSMETNKKAVIIWNRKGFARILSCSHCDYVFKCDRCSGFLKLSLKDNKGTCPYCGKKVDIPSLCPQCRGGYVRSLGLGIERIGAILKRTFPEVKIRRWEERDDQTRIILSTAKILSSLYEKVSFDVGFVLDADSLLSRIDYEAAMDAFFYLKKLSGFFKDTLFVFTCNQNHYLFESLKNNWHDFYEKELSFRKKLSLPPFGCLAKIVLRGKSENQLFSRCKNLYNTLEREGLQIYGPFEEHPFKLRDYYRYALVAKSKNEKMLKRIIKEETVKIRSSHLKVAIIIR